MVNTVKFSQFNQIDLANTTNDLVGVSSPSGGQNLQVSYPLSWDATTQPVAPKAGTLGYNSTLGQYEFWNGIAWIQLASGGSGSVNVGAINEVAFYPANGTAVDGILTQNNAGLFTNPSGVPSMVPATGSGAPVRATTPTLITPILDVATATSLAFTSTEEIIGTTTNNNANVGSVGEFLSSVIPFASSVALTTNVPNNLSSLILHAGDWDLWANISFTATVGMSSARGWLGLISATEPNKEFISDITHTTADIVSTAFPVPMLRFSLNASATVFISGKAVFGSGTASMCGGIYSRVRR